jgi:hypothetical protein
MNQNIDKVIRDGIISEQVMRQAVAYLYERPPWLNKKMPYLRRVKFEKRRIIQDIFNIIEDKTIRDGARINEECSHRNRKRQKIFPGIAI